MTNPMLKVEEVTDFDQWNQMVSAHPKATFCHRAEWVPILKDTYQIQGHLLKATLNGEIQQILSTYICPTLSQKKKAISIPYQGYGGSLKYTNKSYSEFFFTYLKEKYHITYSEERQLHSSAPENQAEEVAMIVPLAENSQKMWQLIKSKVRNQINKAIKEDLTFEFTHDESNFYQIYSKNMHRLGTPVHHQNYFKNIKKFFKENAEYLIVKLQNKPIGGMLLIKNNMTLSDPYASTLTEYNHLCPNMLMYWKAIEKACDQKCQYFDMGRSQMNSGTHQFKKQWGAQPYPIKAEVFSDNQSTSNTTKMYRGKKAELFTSCWSKLPYCLHTWLGPKLRKYIV